MSTNKSVEIAGWKLNAASVANVAAIVRGLNATYKAGESLAGFVLALLKANKGMVGKDVYSVVRKTMQEKMGAATGDIAFEARKPYLRKVVCECLAKLGRKTTERRGGSRRTTSKVTVDTQVCLASEALAKLTGKKAKVEALECLALSLGLTIEVK
jgi:hypothetical protein